LSRYTLGLPQCMSDLALEEFLRTYVADPFGTLLLLPTPSLVHQVRRRMALAGMAVASTSVSTLEELARQLLDVHDPGHVLLEGAEAETLLRSILMEGRDELPIFFRDGELREGFLPELLVLITTCGGYGVGNERLRDLGERGAQLSTVLERYAARLEAGSWIDGPTLLGRAARLLPSSEQRYSKVVIFGHYEPTPAQRTFLKAIETIAADVHLFVPYLDDDKVFSSWHLEDDVASTSERLFPPERMAQMSGLFSSDEKVDVTEWVTLDRYRDQLEEVRRVAQGVQGLIASGTRPNDIAVLLPMRRSAAPLIREVFSDFEIDIEMDIGVSLAESPVVQAVIDVLEVPHSHFRQDALVRMLASPYLRARVVPGEEPVSSFNVDRLSREANVVEGRASWPARFRALVEKFEAEAASPDVPDWRRQQFERKVLEVQEVSRRVEMLLDRLAVLDQERTVGEHVRALRTTLHDLEMDQHLHGSDHELSRREGKALRLFLNVLDRLETSSLLSPMQVPLAKFIAMLKASALDVTFRPGLERKEAVTVAGLRSGALRIFKHIFIPGLVEGDVPKLDLRHPFLGAEEAQRLGLLSNRDILRQERYYFLMALLSAKEAAHLSWAESVDGENVIPSSFVERVRQVWKTGALPKEDLNLSRTGAQMGLGKTVAGQVPLNGAWLEWCIVPPSSLIERINVERCARREGYCTAHDAVLSDDPEIVARMSKLHLEKAYSASMLEDYALCPFRYYMRNILGLEPIEEVSEDIQARDLGSLFHETAFRFYSARRDRGEVKVTSKNLELAKAEMRAIAEEECKPFSFASPAWNASKRRLLGEEDFPGWLGLFLENEAADPLPGLEPGHFELWVGMRLNRSRSDPSSLERFAEVELGVGDPSRVRFRCKVDRVDLDGKGGFFVIDYKTGKNPPGPKDIEEGLALQIPLYILALEAVTGMHGIGGAYYTIGTAQDTKVVPVMGDESVRAMTKRRLDPDLRRQLRQSAAFTQLYIQGMMSARFHPAARTDLCPSSCDFRHMCRFNEMRVIDMGGGDDVDT
jgi:ATP-dependent helicase/nuclease subunit B